MLNVVQKKWIGKKCMELIKLYAEYEFKTTVEDRREVWDKIGSLVDKWYVDSKRNEDVKKELCDTAAYLDRIERNLYTPGDMEG